MHGEGGARVHCKGCGAAALGVQDPESLASCARLCWNQAWTVTHARLPHASQQGAGAAPPLADPQPAPWPGGAVRAGDAGEEEGLDARAAGWSAVSCSAALPQAAVHSVHSFPDLVTPPPCALCAQVFANRPLWKAARHAWQPFFKQAGAGCSKGLWKGLQRSQGTTRHQSLAPCSPCD